MKEAMTVARLHGVRDIRTHTEAIPATAAGEELVRITAVGLCGSDLHWFTEAGIGDARLTRPLVPGHEFAGVIEGGPRHGMPVAVDAALRFGADVVLSVDEAADDIGADAVFELAGTDAAVEIALRAARPGARVVLGGIPDGDRTSFQASLARRKGLTLVLVRRMNEADPRAVRLGVQGVGGVSAVVTPR